MPEIKIFFIQATNVAPETLTEIARTFRQVITGESSTGNPPMIAQQSEAPPAAPPAATPRITGAPPVPQQRRKPLERRIASGKATLGDRNADAADNGKDFTPPKPSQRKSGGRAIVLVNPAHPGKTFTPQEAAKLAGSTPGSVMQAVYKKSTIKGHTFTRNPEGIIPDYPEHHGRTRSEIDGDPMPVNGGRISANDRPPPKDLQRQL